MKNLNVPVSEFLRPFFNPSDRICLRIFADRKEGILFKGMKLETTLSGIDALLPTLHSHNAMNRGIYFVVNAGGHEDSEIERINAHFMECDDLSMEEQWAKIQAFPLPPSIVVRTRKSLHTYWLVHDASVKDFRRIQRELAEHFGGDRTCINESRVLRLPGFNHCKQEPIMVTCVKFNPELSYTQEQLEQHLPRLADTQAAPISPPQGKQAGLEAVLGRCAFMKHCRDNAATLSEHDWYSMITNLAVFDGGEKAIHEMSAKYPRYNAAETQQKIEHFLQSNTKPITCATIADKGFQCPRRLDGSCSCKAPAAMCYLPLSLDELREALQAIPVKRIPADDVRAAKQFIEKHLYNVPSLDASTFIEYDMREHFMLKVSDMKPLAAYQKELYKEYAAKQDSKQSEGAEIPEWYEVTERGGLRFLPGILADYMAKSVDAFYGAGTFYAYEGGVYQQREDLWATHKVREHMIPRSAILNAINDTTGQWKMIVNRQVRDINPNPYLINVRNGLYNLLEDTFSEHTPDYLSTVQIGASYRPELLSQEDCGCPVFQNFLRDVLDEPEIQLVQEILGYMLVPINKAQKSFVLVGAPSAGKSTLVYVAQDLLLGKENVSNIAWQSLGERFNKAELFGKLANIFADLPSKGIDDNGMFKALTGEDYITAERKNKDPFSFRPYARFLFSCNEIPRNYGDRSDGFFRRLILIRFNRSIPPSKQDKSLREKLAAERDGIFMWALEGLRRLMANNYTFSETASTHAELEKYRTESSSSLSFARYYLEAATDAVCVRDDVYEQYKHYCMDSGFKNMSQIAFNKEIEARFPSIQRGRDRVSKRRIWKGLRFVPDGLEIDA